MVQEDGRKAKAEHLAGIAGTLTTWGVQKENVVRL